MRAYKVTGDSSPRFEIGGKHYGVESGQEFGFVPNMDGPVRYLNLVEIASPHVSTN